MTTFLAVLLLLFEMIGIVLLITIPLTILAKIGGVQPRVYRSNLTGMITRGYRYTPNANLEKTIMDAQWKYDAIWGKKGK